MTNTRHSPQHAIDELRSVGDLIRWGSSRFSEAELFFGHGTDNAWDEATALVLHGLYLPHDAHPRVLDSRTTHAEREAVIALLQRRINDRLPAAYLTGEAWFAGLQFRVNQHVLVPRSPIAELIEASFEPWLGGLPLQRIADLGTGSGCIAIACALAFPEAEVDAVDISPEALQVTRENIARYDLDQRVNALQSDLFEALPGRVYDLIVSNPPYVDQAAMDALPTEYHREPELGLAAGELGLDIVERMLAEAAAHLSEDGLLVVEVGNSAAALEQRYPSVPFEWPELEHGGHGVFVLSAAQLREHADELTN